MGLRLGGAIDPVTANGGSRKVDTDLLWTNGVGSAAHRKHSRVHGPCAGSESRGVDVKVVSDYISVGQNTNTHVSGIVWIQQLQR